MNQSINILSEKRKNHPRPVKDMYITKVKVKFHRIPFPAHTLRLLIINKVSKCYSISNYFTLSLFRDAVV